MSDLSERIVLCEGYHDRAFLAGLFKHRGWVVPDLKIDPWGKRWTGGQFGFVKDRCFVRIVSCGGDSKILDKASYYLEALAVQPWSRLVVLSDDDTLVDEPGQPVVSFAAFRDCVVKAHPQARIVEPRIFLQDRQAVAVLMQWRSPAVHHPRLPRKQTLERVVCSAIATAHPERADAVQQWLAARPAPPASSPKEFLWSHMAGWSAEDGCERFLEAGWESPTIAQALREQLQAIGAWSIFEDIERVEIA